LFSPLYFIYSIPFKFVFVFSDHKNKNMYRLSRALY